MIDNETKNNSAALYTNETMMERMKGEKVESVVRLDRFLKMMSCD